MHGPHPASASGTPALWQALVSKQPSASSILTPGQGERWSWQRSLPITCTRTYTSQAPGLTLGLLGLPFLSPPPAQKYRRHLFS